MIIGTRIFNKNKIIWLEKQDNLEAKTYLINIKFTNDADVKFRDYIIYNLKEERDAVFIQANKDLDSKD